MNQTSKLVLDVPRASLTLILDFVGRGSDRNIVIGGGTADVELLIVEDDPFVGCWLQDETVLKKSCQRGRPDWGRPSSTVQRDRPFLPYSLDPIICTGSISGFKINSWPWSPNRKWVRISIKTQFRNWNACTGYIFFCFVLFA